MTAFGKTKTVGICRFTKTLLNGNPDIGSYNWRDIIQFTKSLARVLADYGEVTGWGINCRIYRNI